MQPARKHHQAESATHPESFCGGGESPVVLVPVLICHCAVLNRVCLPCSLLWGGDSPGIFVELDCVHDDLKQKLCWDCYDSRSKCKWTPIYKFSGSTSSHHESIKAQ